MIRQTPTGMEQQCVACVKAGLPETWWPLTAEFFGIRHRGHRGLLHYLTTCRACRHEQRQASRKRCKARDAA